MTNGLEITLFSFTFIKNPVLSSYGGGHEPVPNMSFESSFFGNVSMEWGEG